MAGWPPGAKAMEDALPTPPVSTVIVCQVPEARVTSSKEPGSTREDVPSGDRGLAGGVEGKRRFRGQEGIR